MARIGPGNEKLAAAISEARLSHEQVARDFVRVAEETGAHEHARVGRSHVSHWIAGSQPSGRAPIILCEALSRRLGRLVTPEDIGLTDGSRGTVNPLDWHLDTLAALVDLGKVDLDMERRRLLGAAAYSAAALVLPGPSWWTQMAGRGALRGSTGSRTVGRPEIEAVRETTAMFARLDQRRGGGHARTLVVQYLTSDVAGLLGGSFGDEGVRREMFSAASELAYLSGWMAFDNSEHPIAQRYFAVGVKLAAEADDAPMAGYVLRAMAHQAVDLGHIRAGLDLAAAATRRERYERASPRERALLGVVHARTLAAAGENRAAAAALVKAENDLAAARPGDDEPSRVFFFGEASLAHETDCALRDMGDLAGAVRQYEHSVRTRKADTFTRTHAVTLGYLGAVQARQGNLDEACATWSMSLRAMDGVRSGRTREVARDIRATLSPLRRRGLRSVADVDAGAAAYLSTVY